MPVNLNLSNRTGGANGGGGGKSPLRAAWDKFLQTGSMQDANIFEQLYNIKVPYAQPLIRMNASTARGHLNPVEQNIVSHMRNTLGSLAAAHKRGMETGNLRQFSNADFRLRYAADFFDRHGGPGISSYYRSLLGSREASLNLHGAFHGGGMGIPTAALDALRSIGERQISLLEKIAQNTSGGGSGGGGKSGGGRYSSAMSPEERRKQADAAWGRSTKLRHAYDTAVRMQEEKAREGSALDIFLRNNTPRIMRPLVDPILRQRYQQRMARVIYPDMDKYSKNPSLVKNAMSMIGRGSILGDMGMGFMAGEIADPAGGGAIGALLGIGAVATVAVARKAMGLYRFLSPFTYKGAAIKEQIAAIRRLTGMPSGVLQNMGSSSLGQLAKYGFAGQTLLNNIQELGLYGSANVGSTILAATRSSAFGGLPKSMVYGMYRSLQTAYGTGFSSRGNLMGNFVSGLMAHDIPKAAAFSAALNILSATTQQGINPNLRVNESIYGRMLSEFPNMPTARSGAMYANYLQANNAAASSFTKTPLGMMAASVFFKGVSTVPELRRRLASILGKRDAAKELRNLGSPMVNRLLSWIKEGPIFAGVAADVLGKNSDLVTKMAYQFIAGQSQNSNLALIGAHNMTGAPYLSLFADLYGKNNSKLVSAKNLKLVMGGAASAYGLSSSQALKQFSVDVGTFHLTAKAFTNLNMAIAKSADALSEGTHNSLAAAAKDAGDAILQFGKSISKVIKNIERASTNQKHPNPYVIYVDGYPSIPVGGMFTKEY